MSQGYQMAPLQPRKDYRGTREKFAYANLLTRRIEAQLDLLLAKWKRRTALNPEEKP